MSEPINIEQQELVCAATVACVQRAAAIFQRDLAPISVSFDLRGRAAGMYRVRRGCRSIRYNPYIFARYFDDGLVATVPHEVAHYVTDMLYGLERVRPHGVEWRTVMRALGAEPRATANYDLTGLPIRRQRRYAYRCSCMTHQFSTRRHNMVDHGTTAYRCRRCGSPLVYTG